MKTEIVNFITFACETLKARANYLYDGDIYMIHKDGKAVQNFTTSQFYEIPKRERIRDWERLIRIGLVNNLGEKNVKEQLLMPIKFGHVIV